MNTYLIDRLEVVLHTFNGDVFPSLDALGLKHFRKGALALLAYQSVLLHLFI